MKFRPKKQHELQNASDEEIIEYVVSARDAGQAEAVRDALAILVYGRFPFLTAFLSKRISGNWQDAEDLAATVMENAIKSTFDGVSVGQFVNFLKTIAKRRAIDFNEKAVRQKNETPYDPSDPENYTEISLGGDEDGKVEVEMVAEQVISGLNPSHRQVVKFRIEGYSSKETAALINGSGNGISNDMTAANTDQIYKRFRDQLRDQLGMGGY